MDTPIKEKSSEDDFSAFDLLTQDEFLSCPRCGCGEVFITFVGIKPLIKTKAMLTRSSPAASIKFQGGCGHYWFFNFKTEGSNTKVSVWCSKRAGV